MDARLRIELAELVEDQLGRDAVDAPKLSCLAIGIAQILGVLGDLAARRGNFADLRSRLLDGRATITVGLKLDAAVDARLERFARTKHDFAGVLVGEIERLQAGETTLV